MPAVDSDFGKMEPQKKQKGHENMKKVRCTLLALIMAFTAMVSLPFHANAAADPTITIESGSTVVGEDVEIDISLANNPGLIGLRITLEFDSDLELISVTNTGNLVEGDGDDGTNDEYDGNFICGKDMTSPFVLCWEASTANSNLTGNGVIAVLKFDTELLSEGESANIKVTVNDAFDYDLEEFTVSVVDGKVTVTEGQSALKGDVNLDGVVDMEDAVALQRHVLKAEIITNEASLAASEVNGDGVVDMNDAVSLMRYVLKVDATLG